MMLLLIKNTTFFKNFFKIFCLFMNIFKLHFLDNSNIRYFSSCSTLDILEHKVIIDGNNSLKIIVDKFVYQS